MHLIGSTDSFIKVPYIIEGAFYGLIGGLVAATIIIVPWYIVIYYIQGTDYVLWINQMLNDFGVGFLQHLDPLFIIIYYLVHLFVGLILGTASSLSALKKYLTFTNTDDK